MDSHIAFAVDIRMINFSHLPTFIMQPFFSGFVAIVLIANTAEKVFSLLYTLSAVYVTVNSFINLTSVLLSNLA